MIAQAGVGGAEAVPGRGLAIGVAEALKLGQRRPAAGEPAEGLAEVGAVSANEVEAVGLPATVTGRPVELGSPLRMFEGGSPHQPHSCQWAHPVVDPLHAGVRARVLPLLLSPLPEE